MHGSRHHAAIRAPGVGDSPAPALRSGRPWRAALTIAALTGVFASGGCGEGPAAVRVAAVTITSPIGDVMAAGRSVELTASAEDASGGPVSGQTFDWRSSDPGVATVSATGVVEGVAAGTTTLSAATDGVTGTLTMRVVEADLATIEVLLDDAYTQRLAASLGAGPGDAVATVLDDCAVALDDGNVLALADCLGSIPEVDRSDATDHALLAVLEVIARRAALLLNL